MLHDLLLSALLAWAAYCAWRVATARGNAVQVEAEASTRAPVGFAFATYLKVREFYCELSPAHRKYEMHGHELMHDVVIDVWEEAGFQLVKHRYRVVDLVPNRRMSLVSEASRVRVLGLFEGRSRSEVEFRFAAAGDDAAQLGLTIRIVFPNVLRHWLARMFFTEIIWQLHAQQEMTALAKLIERRYAAADDRATTAQA